MFQFANLQRAQLPTMSADGSALAAQAMQSAQSSAASNASAQGLPGGQPDSQGGQAAAPPGLSDLHNWMASQGYGFPAAGADAGFGGAAGAGEAAGAGAGAGAAGGASGAAAAGGSNLMAQIAAMFL